MERKAPDSQSLLRRFNPEHSGWIQGIICSVIGSIILFVATEIQMVEKVFFAKLGLSLIGLFLIVFFGLPWLFFGFIYLTLGKMGKAESWAKNGLLSKYPRSHYLRTMFDSSYKGETLFAVTAFVLSKHQKDKFLWVKHRTHNRWLPPGGRLLVNELPHEAIKEKICAETNIPVKTLTFCEKFHKIDNSHIADTEPVEPAPIPLMIQKEIMEQRGGMPYHYDFFYVLETDYTGIPEGEQNPKWLSIEEVEKTSLGEQPFPNVLSLAKQISQYAISTTQVDKEAK